MRAELKNYFSPDFDIKTYWPENEKIFHFLLSLSIGPEGDDASNNFDVEIISFQWMECNSEDLILGGNKIFLREYDIPLLISKIERYCNKCIGNSWDEIVNQLSRLGRFEYD
ncbi:immunity protein 8 of polymorphic toxin system [Shewanella chilikensis]|uniref:Immunity protein 8 of polymorphic toxin system n=1 Tax=Shewanella chilikensis TaxID=558541 RepID=A0ABX5PHI2_9GAMM|nr:Imm8 family immunity protein [Shewanella chilikensis]MCL1156196.1 immunity 8 family protein [Shewanella chilikensis]PYE53692.1 immunity protein 8 of polymorphic toxin system [Shewanella chilikensis]GGZ48359.1 hypothetical protein GCM10007105_37880 [Shewanella chilikensis]